MPRIKTYRILRRIYNKEGVNDGQIFEIVDKKFNNISFHKNEKSAKNKIKKLL